MSIQQQIISYLASNGFGTKGYSLFVNEIPDNNNVSNNSIVISSASGSMNKYVNDRISFFSVVIRNKTDNGADLIFENLRGLLHQNKNCIREFVAGGDLIKDIYIEDELNYVGKDVNNRYLYEFTLKLYYERN